MRDMWHAVAVVTWQDNGGIFRVTGGCMNEADPLGKVQAGSLKRRYGSVGMDKSSLRLDGLTCVR